MAETNRYHMEQREARELLRATPVHEFSRACNVDPRDHFHLGRVGDPGSCLNARGVLQIHEGGRLAKVYLAAPELRQLASALLNVADEIDGKTPLVFFDPSAPSAEEPQNDPEA